jgi:glycerol-3-phosphate O-acyltransferase
MMHYIQLSSKHIWIHCYRKVITSSASLVCIYYIFHLNIAYASLEGGRSRTGKLLQPKFGILSFLLESVLSGQVEDAIICPVSTQYDKVIEVE